MQKPDQAGWLAATLLAASIGGCAGGQPSPPADEPVAQQSEPMAQIVARADDLSLELTIENIDGKTVNVPEAVIRDITAGDHYMGVKVLYKPISPTGLMFGIDVIGAISHVAAQSESHTAVSFTAKPGVRYQITGAMDDGRPLIWVENDQTDEVVSEKVR